MQLYRHLTANHVSLKAMPFFRELSMEAYLIENPDVLALDEEDLSSVSIEEAEVVIPGSRKARQADGRIDLIAVYGDSTIGILELKLGELRQSHLDQLADYIATLSGDKERLRKLIDAEEPKLLGVLVGSSITSELRAKIEQGCLIADEIPIAALTLTRYKGDDNNVYVVTDTFFFNSSRKFDRTKYSFNCETLGKGRLVLAAIRQYVSERGPLMFDELEKAFPKRVQGSSGCFATVEKAQKIQYEDRKRHFLEPDEVIELSDGKVAVSNQWGKTSIPRFLETARKLGLKIEEADSSQ